MIAVLFMLPLIASYLAFFVWRPQARISYGDLLEVRPLAASTLPTIDGGAFQLTDLRGKWVMVSIDSGACATPCAAKLSMMQQQSLMQGRGMDRLERVFLVEDDAPVSSELLRQFRGTKVLRAGGSRLLSAFPAKKSRRDHIYLVDPQGNLMMRFPRAPDANRMNSDLSRLFKEQGAV
ncbi:MAG: cytochrome C oxidase subunit I [Betaproteobacteria bacterium]|nr:cytochrome C oxidase subunit I [Betaproteobacteria bacterium]